MNERGMWDRDRRKARSEGMTPPVPIAIVGMGCRLPGGIIDYAGMWQFLLDRRTAIQEIPADRWSILAFHDTDPNALGRGRSRWAGFLDNVFDFDPGFFDLSPREALAMDPQQRMLLQVAYEAAQDAGISLADLSEARTGVFVGVSSMEFASTQRVQTGSGDIFGGTGSALSIIANRISHRLNLNGPSFVVDTACSSALVALDQACRNLADGNCDYAFAGGVNCLLDPSAFIAFAKANMLSPTGGCYSFDHRADGFIRGEGSGLILLKRLDQALRDGDSVHAVIRATGVNQDGRTSTLTSPNGVAQETLMREVVDLAGLVPDDIGYVEAHGTGTPTGDPIEANAIGRVFGRDRDGGPLPVSSIKPNVGHLESAAGIAGILKAVMTLKERTIAPHQNFEEANPAIPLDALNITIPTEALEFPATDGARRVVVNSFGFGGTSACAVVEDVTAPTASPDRPIEIRKREAVPGPQLVPISAPDAEGLAAWAGTLADAVRTGNAEPSAVAHALAKRDQFASRAVVLSDGSREHLVDALEKVAGKDGGEDDPANEIIANGSVAGRRLVFTFSGQGAQWWAMGRQLLHDDKHYRASIEAFDSHFEPLAGWRVADALMASESESRINESQVTQAALIAMQVALAAAWRARGVVPDVVLGHSLGEIAAAHVAGAISLETTARIIYQRGLIAEQSPEAGAMAAVGLPAETVEAYLTEGEDVVIGAMNGPAMVTLTGVADAMDKVLAAIRAAEPNAFVRRLNTGFAWHSRLLDHGEAWFRSELGEIAWTTPTIPIISTVEPGIQVRFDLDYWWKNLRQPVRYRDAVLLALELGLDSFLEIGPHRTVTPLTVSVANEKGGPFIAVPSLVRGSDDHLAMARSAAQLFVGGHKIDWNRYAAPASGKAFTPPLYPWQNQTLRQYSTEASFHLFEPVVHPLLGRRDFGPTPRWVSEIDGKAFPYFRDHRILGGAVLPAAGYVEMMVAALRAENGPGTVELRSLQFPEALPLDGDISVMLRTEYDPVLGKLRVYSRERGQDEDWRLRAEGYGLSRPIAAPDAAPPSLPAGKPDPTIDGPAFYELADRHGYEYGRYFRGVDSIWLTGDDSSVAVITEPDGLNAAERGYTLHPATFDSALQSAIALYDRNKGIWDPEEPDADADSNAFVMRIPVEIDKILVYDTLPERSLAEFIADDDGETGVYRLYSEDGRPAVIVERLRTKALKSNRRADDAATPAAFYVEQFRPASQPQIDAESDATEASWLLICADASAASLSESFGKRGAALTTITPEEVAAGRLAEAIGTKASEKSAVAGIVYAPMLGFETLDPAGATNKALTTLVEIAETIASKDAASVPRLVLLTSGAREIAGDPPATAAGIAGRALLAALRTIGNERPTMEWRSIDIGHDLAGSTDMVSQAIVASDPETERVLRGTTWYVPRLEPVSDEQKRARRLEIDTKTDSRNYAVTLSQPGSLDNVVIREAATPVADEGELVVEIAAVGLNFRDIMAATSILPGEVEGDEAWWRNLGFEFSGIVRSVGPGETKHKVGDRVLGLGKGFMRRFAKVNTNAVSRIPDGIDLTAAATVPIAFLTAEYGLVELGRLRPGESILIHLGTGGVGLAAIQIARAIGATIFATAGNDEKRQYLRDLGIEHVMDSRSLDFAEQVREATGGRGVDVVLNALSGAAIEKGLECLAPFGRFVEIGKRDLAADHPIGLRSLYHNNSYAVFDLGEMLDQASQLIEKPFQTVIEMLENGTYKPLPTTVFPASEAADAMRHLAKAVHIGKVVVAFNETEVSVERDLSTRAALRADATYLVTGGLRGFGLTVAEWMAAHGAGSLVLASRSGAPDEADAARVAKMAERTEIRSIALDVTDAEAVNELVASLAKGDKPLAGIVHSAAIIDDALLDQLAPERIAGVVDPKLGGAWNLHRAAETAGAELDHFVTFSSVATALGSIGQTNYVAANAGLERLSEYRRARGLAGMAIGWGSLAESGFVARSDAMKSYLASAGIRPLTDEEAFAGLDQLIRIDSSAMIYAAVDWAALGRAMPGGNAPRLAALAADRARGGNRLAVRLASAPESEHEGIVAEAIREEVAKVLRIEPTAIAFDRRLTELGLDSLSSFELKNHIEALCDLTIPVAKFLQAPTVGGLATIVAGLLATQRAKQAAAELDTGSSTNVAASDALPILPRQALFLGLGESPAANDTTRAALQLIHSIPVDASLEAKALEDAVAALAGREEAVRLIAERADDGTWRIDFGPAPALRRLGADDALPYLPDASGALWAFALRGDQDKRELTVQAHRAGADQASIMRAANAVVEIAGGSEPTASRLSWSAFAEEHAPAEGSDPYRRHYAYWTEMLGRAPTPLLPAERTRALMPARVGVSRGQLRSRAGSVSVPAFESLPVEEREVAAIAAFARAIGLDLGSDAVVVERHDPVRQEAGENAPLGPVADALPIILSGVLGPGERLADRTRRAMAGAQHHRTFDRAALGQVFERILTSRPVALSEFGFSLTDTPTGNDARESLLAAEPWNALRLNLMPGDSGSHMQLVFDAEAIGEEAVDRIARTFREELASLLGADAGAWKTPLAETKATATLAKAGSTRPGSPHVMTRKGNLLPVSMQQHWLLSTLADPRSTDVYHRFWIVSRSYWVRPNIDVAQLKGIVDGLARRHDALRSRFVMEGGEYRLRIEDKGTNQVIVEDLGDVGEAAALQRVRELTETPLNPLIDPLYVVRVLRCGKAGDLLVCLGHHSILDGWSMSLLVEELMAQFFGLPLAPVELSMADYLRDFDRSHDRAELQRREAYFRRLLAEPPAIPNLGRVSKGVTPNLDMVEAGPGAELVVPLGDRGKAAIAQAVRNSGASETALLLASFAETLARNGGVDDATILIPAAMRTDRRLRYFVGWAATLMPVRAKVSQHDSTASLAQSLAGQIRDSMSYLPADFALLDSIQHELSEAGSYIALFNAGMQTVDSLYRGSATAAFHRPGGGEQIDFGPVQIEKVGDESVRSESVWELDLRSFDAADGKAIRLGYDTLGFSRDEAEVILAEVLGRLGADEEEATLSERPAAE